MPARPFHQGLAACEAQIRAHLEPGEHALAVGRGEDVTEAGAGPGWTFVMVTDRVLRWIPNLDLRLEASLALDSVTDVTERTVAHRYAIDLEHRPLTRLHHVPKHRFLKFEWGNDFANDVFTRTSLAFSRIVARPCELHVVQRDDIRQAHALRKEHRRITNSGNRAMRVQCRRAAQGFAFHESDQVRQGDGDEQIRVGCECHRHL